ARFVRDWAPDLVQQVIAGGSLRQAYDIAQQRKQREEEQARRELARQRAEAATFAALERDYPEIAAKVTVDGWTVPQALAEANLEEETQVITGYNLPPPWETAS